MSGVEHLREAAKVGIPLRLEPETVLALCDVVAAAQRRQALMDSPETTAAVNAAFIAAGDDLRAALARLEET